MYPNNRLLLVVYSLLIAVTWVSAANGECLSLRGEKREVIDAREILNNEQNVLECLAFSLQKGKVNQARSILDLYGEQYEALIIKVIEKELHRLELIEEDIVQGESNCVPVVKWGQNQTHLFMVTKMSHRWDSPPCLNTKIQNVEIFNNTFEYINVCLVSHQKITFNLTLALYSDVKEQVKVVNEGVGTFSVIIEKREAQVWPFLTKEETIYQIWNEIAQRYNPVHKQYTDLLNTKLRERKSKPVSYENSTASEKKRTKNKESNQTNQSKEQREAVQGQQININQNSKSDDFVTLQTLEQLESEERSTLKIVQGVTKNQQQVQNSRVVDESQQKENSMEIRLQNGQ